MGSLILKVYVGIITLITVVSLAYVYLAPPPSMKMARDGVPHFTPDVIHPETGKAVPMGDLIRHFRGD